MMVVEVVDQSSLLLLNESIFLPFYITRATIMPGLKKGQVEKSGCLEKSAELQAVREIRGRMQHLKMPQSFV